MKSKLAPELQSNHWCWPVWVGSHQLRSLCSSCWSWCGEENPPDGAGSLCSPVWSPLQGQKKKKKVNLGFTLSTQNLNGFGKTHLNCYCETTLWTHLWKGSESSTWRCCMTAALQWSWGALLPPAGGPRAAWSAAPGTWGWDWRCCGWCSWLEPPSPSGDSCRGQAGWKVLGETRNLDSSEGTELHKRAWCWQPFLMRLNQWSFKLCLRARWNFN